MHKREPIFIHSLKFVSSPRHRRIWWTNLELGQMGTNSGFGSVCERKTQKLFKFTISKTKMWPATMTMCVKRGRRSRRGRKNTFAQSHKPDIDCLSVMVSDESDTKHAPRTRTQQNSLPLFIKKTKRMKKKWKKYFPAESTQHRTIHFHRFGIPFSSGSRHRICATLVLTTPTQKSDAALCRRHSTLFRSPSLQRRVDPEYG